MANFCTCLVTVWPYCSSVMDWMECPNEMARFIHLNTPPLTTQQPWTPAHTNPRDVYAANVSS